MQCHSIMQATQLSEADELPPKRQKTNPEKDPLLFLLSQIQQSQQRLEARMDVQFGIVNEKLRKLESKQEEIMVKLNTVAVSRLASASLGLSRAVPPTIPAAVVFRIPDCPARPHAS